MNTFFEILSYLIALFCMQTAIRVLRENPRLNISRSFFGLALSCFFYSLFYGFMASEHERQMAELYYRISSIGWGALPSTTLLFVIDFYSHLKDRHLGYVKFIVLLPMFVFIPAGLSGHLLAQEFFRTKFGWVESGLINSPLDTAYLVMVFGTLTICTAVLLWQRRQAETRRGKSLILRVALPLLTAGGLSLITNIIFGLMPGIHIPAMAHLWFGGSAVIIGYSALKLQFFNSIPNLVTGDILELMTDICIITDKEHRVYKISQAARDFWGIRHIPFAQSANGNGSPESKILLSGLLGMELETPGRDETRTGILELTGRDGKVVPFQYTMKSIYDRFDELLGYFLIARNAEELKNLERKTGRLKGMNEHLKELSETDALTGIYNRMKFNQLLEREFRKSQRYGQPFSLIMFDLDNFKQVNDIHGHDAGDWVLVAVCRAIESILRDLDAFSRWGGEEFMVLCGNTDLEGATQLAHRLKVILEELVIEPVGRVTASFGVAEYRLHEKKAELLYRTDAHLYKAKAQGKNRVVSR